MKVPWHCWEGRFKRYNINIEKRWPFVERLVIKGPWHDIVEREHWSDVTLMLKKLVNYNISMKLPSMVMGVSNTPPHANLMNMQLLDKKTKYEHLPLLYYFLWGLRQPWLFRDVGSIFVMVAQHAYEEPLKFLRKINIMLTSRDFTFDGQRRTQNVA